jgi:hypothetical protein
MTMKRFSGRCAHCGHDHDADQAMFEAALKEVPSEKGDSWIPVSNRLPDYDVMVLVADGVHFAAGWRSFSIEEPTRMRGYEPDGSINPQRFTEYVPNPEVGKRTEFFHAHGCSAFSAETDVSDWDGPIDFEPTHWMPLPEPPK